MINFVFPTPEVRLKLWKTVLPKKVVLEEEIDFEFFAYNFELAGSNIKDILTTAAYIAASEHTGLANRHIVEAVKLNFKKYGKILTNEDFGYLGTNK
jgi:ATP-dependent 26S proteasome regulatory subunit